MPSKQYDDVLKMLNSLPEESGLSFEERRVNTEKATSMLPVSEGVSCESVSADGVSAEWIVPESAPEQNVLLYLHGGGYCVGSINTHRGLVSHIATAAETRALSIDYRLAPEYPFPAAIEDSVSAYKWLLSQDISEKGIVIAGDSAGGGLTASTLVSLKENGIPLPAAAVLISPWVDLAMTGDSMISKADIDPMVTKEGLIENAEAYMDGADPRTPLASPLYADLEDLPPMLIHVGTAEILLDDATRMADQARKVDVEVTLYTAEDMCHVWHMFVPMLPEAVEAIEEIARFMQKHYSTS